MAHTPHHRRPAGPAAGASRIRPALTFSLMRGYWRLLLWLRVPPPQWLAPGLWQPWRLPAVRACLAIARVLLFAAAILLLPWAAAALLLL